MKMTREIFLKKKEQAQNANIYVLFTPTKNIVEQLASSITSKKVTKKIKTRHIATIQKNLCLGKKVNY